MQSRSRERVERILDAARELVCELGMDAVTTRAIAERAAVPVATLYQFFANREAVFEQLLERDMERIDRQVAVDVETLRATSIADAIAVFAATHRTHFLRHLGLVALYFAVADRELVRIHQRRCAQAFGRLLLNSGVMPAHTDPRVFGVAIAIAEGTIEHAYRDAPRNEWVVGQGRLVLQLYLESHCDGAGPN
ncbi:TetR/AcrR family transcriptional regulator [Nocardia sp. NBC_01503]|uniref:TetR/AcrR family transcriptional regulator n=1 Tax=Nocardia sp. NBC_01503 TaxID=2975997 RepID=UPI002E7C334D|nr:helix-turn-helix domain-containing protein [Nocardia sp. NBC_01503]WTL34891.1 TetR/AcrR family transcriptional regulator [Nocardia sp. NBC_01503]